MFLVYFFLEIINPSWFNIEELYSHNIIIFILWIIIRYIWIIIIEISTTDGPLSTMIKISNYLFLELKMSQGIQTTWIFNFIPESKIEHELLFLKHEIYINLRLIKSSRANSLKESLIKTLNRWKSLWKYLNIWYNNTR